MGRAKPVTPRRGPQPIWPAPLAPPVSPGRGPGHRLRRGGAGQPGPVHRERGPARHRPGPGPPILGELSWVLNGYAIVYAALLVFFGRLADRHRRNYGFLLGVAVFTVASAACAASTSVGMLVAFRLVQAAGAALLTPTSLGLVLASYPPERRRGRCGPGPRWAAWRRPSARWSAGCWSRRAGGGCSWSTCRSGSRR